MKEKFKWDKFIVDCFICVFLMILSIPVFFIPAWIVDTLIAGIFNIIYIFTKNEINILSGFREFALFLTLCNVLFFGIWFLLETKNIIKYKIYKPSFIVIFILFIVFWWGGIANLRIGYFF